MPLCTARQGEAKPKSHVKIKDSFNVSLRKMPYKHMKLFLYYSYVMVTKVVWIVK